MYAIRSYYETAEAALARYGDGKGPAPLAVAQSASAQAGSSDAASTAPQATAKPQEGAGLSDVAKDYYNAVSLV